MLTTSSKKVLNRAARVNILSGFTEVLLKRVSIQLLLGLMVLSSFSFSAPASAAPVAFAYVGSNSSNGNNVYLNFNKQFTINNDPNDTTVTANTYLRSYMSIATDGVNFVPLSNQIDVYPPGLGKAGTTQIRLYANNDMKVIQGTNTLIKIASGTLTDADGSINAEMILHVTPPVIQSAAISSNYHDVTIAFQEDVVDNTYSGGVSSLISYIYLLKNGAASNDQTALTEGDTASIESGKLVIHFATALSGVTNQIRINGGALKDSYGNVLNDNTLTPLIQGVAATGDTTSLQYINGYLSNGYQDLTLVFNKDVLNAKSDEASFRAGTQYYGASDTGYRWVPIPNDATLTFSGKTVSIHFAVKLTSQQYYFQFNPGSFKNTSGNIYNQHVGAGWFYPGQPLTLENESLSHDGRWLNLNFNANIADQTIVSGVSHLKDQITINGSSLDAQDVVVIQGYNLVVFFHDAKKSGTVEVKIAANALRDLGNNVQNKAIDQVVAYNYPDITGFFLSDTASEFVFEDNAEWRSKVRDVTIYDNNSGVVRQLNSSEYTLAAGELTINKGVFQVSNYYYITIDADGYSSKSFNGYAYTSSEIFYMTAPVVTADNGITAKANILNNVGTNGTQSVVFELMNGTTPVSIVASNLQVNTGTYTANFNVTDAATNPNYTVRVFVVNKFNNDPTNVGLNLATEVTQTEYDQKLFNNNND
ncbi:Protein of unknown function [Paenibacillus sp. yr247]|uniref:hemoblobin-interacting domain-containing protein n=1 Tax=Paenibacillus sp. yr247 TaxID=1761880 RepID=UPI00087F0C2C|nr:hemoblobin-interacting domain-containing protein [Paenibacillus sp. yr247]SDO16679.1 Protein of unknown function [Paenibacillus sp. yr247]